MKHITVNLSSKILISFFLALVCWWFFITANGLQDTTQNFLYGALEGVLPVIAAVFGFVNAKKWGWLGSTTGKGVFFLSAGLLTWGIGTIVFAYYNIFLQVAVPYPSIADAFYIVSWPLWVTSMFYLSKITGVGFQLRSTLGRVLLLIIPIITISLSYYILIVVAREGVFSVSGGLKTFFDLAYPIGDVVILTGAALVYSLSFNYLGGFFKWPIMILLFGFVLNYISDSAFVYTTTKGTYFVANATDLMYTAAFFLLGLGVCLMDPYLFSKNTK